MDSESKLSLLIYQIISLDDSTASNSEFISVTRGIYSLIKSMDLDSKRKPETESELISLIKQIIYLVSSVSDSEPDSEFKFKALLIELVSLLSSIESDLDPKQEQLSELMVLISQVLYYLLSLASDSELSSCIVRLYSHVSPKYAESIIPQRLTYIDPVLEPEAKLISLVSRFLFVQLYGLEFISTIYEIVYFLKHMDLDSQHNKPESRLMTLTTQTISFFNSMDLDSEPEPLRQLISLISQEYNSSSDLKLKPLIHQTLWLEPEPELMSRIHQIFSLAISMDSKCQKLISLCPQVEVNLEKGKFHVTGKVEGSNKRSDCLPVFWNKISLLGKQVTHFHCFGCNGENHGTYEKAPAEIKHPLHPKHSLQLVLWRESDGNRKCYCCNVRLGYIIYCCLVCNYAMNIACVEKPTLLSIDHSKWHEHTLSHFPRQASITCDLCALADSSSPFYVCLLCDFVVHQSCLSLPHVMRISRHPHRISFTPSFGQGYWSCGVCRREINNDYGGYSCVKNGCSYAAHSKCATQRNMWDGKELYGEPEEAEEEVKPPFLRIGDGIIQHFSHEHHHLKLEENAGRDYDENKQCQACVMPIYFNKYYSCMQCEFILHEACANLSRKMHHPIHPHMLTLVGGYDRVIIMKAGIRNYEISCSACPWLCTAGFFYECDKEGCRFKVHVQCATISEPLDHESHMHPLFLTSKPGENRRCSICGNGAYPETFNCIDCDFSLCFYCATLPQTVRYKHDKHMLSLSYGKEKETSTYWCEACEGKISPKAGFYMCDEYCCVNLHIGCLIGKDFYVKPGASLLYNHRKVGVLPNNQHMSRPFCAFCENRCPYKIVFQRSGLIFCSITCMYSRITVLGIRDQIA